SFVSGERRLPACTSRQLAETPSVRSLWSVTGCSRQAAGYWRLAACAPQSESARGDLNKACDVSQFRADLPLMKHRFLSRHFLFPLSILAAVATTNAADKRNITEKDLFDFVWVGDAQVSPDGGRVAL